MANPEHLKILRQGVSVWNAWRREHPEIWIDLCFADLRMARLSEVDFDKAYLSKADFRETNLRRANLRNADLFAADFSGADLSRADLNRARLSSRVKLIGTKLIRSDLREADCKEADLREADLSGADLSGVDFRLATLIRANLNGATLTDACLWECHRAGWSIRGIHCEAAYLDKSRRERTLYSAGEFERLYADKTKIVLHYKGGISPIEIATLPALIQRIEATHPGCVLRLQSVQEAPGGATVTLIVEKDGGGSSNELCTLKVAMETAAQDVIRYQRAWLKETGRREQIESMYNRLMDQMIGKSQGINISFNGSTIQGNIVGHLSGRDAEVNYDKHPSTGDTEA